MIQLIYASAATRHFSLRELEEMLSRARIRNQARGITGIIVFHERRFLQILEGEKNIVEALFEKISRDARHDHIELILKKEIEERSFGDWSMGLCHTTAKQAEEFPGLFEFLDVTHPFEDVEERAKEILLRFRDGAWHHLLN